MAVKVSPWFFEVVMRSWLWLPKL